MAGPGAVSPDLAWHTIFEPFRIKAVEPIPLLTRAQRESALEAAGHNLFKLPATAVTIDLLTDSGTGALSATQQAALLLGDESYAGGRSFQQFERVVQRLTGYPYVFPVHQGRAAERILARVDLKPGDLVVSNTLFDTTRANIEQAGAIGLDLPVSSSRVPSDRSPFKGDLNVDELVRLLTAQRPKFVILTITNNAAGGQPVSMANIAAVSACCHAVGIPMLLDAARFAENAWFVHEREPGWGDTSIPAIARAAFDLADGCLLSAKKDGISHIGGLFATRDPVLAEKFRNELILGEGFPTYGGLAGRDLSCIAVGLEEALDPDYLRYRARSVAYFAEGLQRAGIPVVEPPGGHAVFCDAGALLPHLSPDELPGQALAAALYLEGGVRGVEIGRLMFPHASLQLVRLALPRRVYTQSHVDYVIEVAERVARRAGDIPGYRIVEEPAFLRHFSAVMAVIPPTTPGHSASPPPAPSPAG